MGDNAHCRANVGSAPMDTPAIVGSDAGAALLAEPKVVPPVPLADKANLETVADRYRRVGGDVFQFHCHAAAGHQ